MNLSPARWAREVCSLKVFTGISRECLGELVVELAPKWVHACDSDRERSRGHERMRAQGAGRPYALVFTDRVLVTLVGMRLGLPHAALASMFGCSRQRRRRCGQGSQAVVGGTWFRHPDRGAAVGDPGRRVRLRPSQ